MKKYFFIFYRERHHFLNQKWWFRAIIVAYVLVLVSIPLLVFSHLMQTSSGWCFDTLYFYAGSDDFQERFAECSKFAREARPIAIAFAIFSTLSIHYLVQFIFFKIIIDFIVMGGKSTHDQHTEK